ncbi:hypothetical protein Droror1_Dr00000744 [Drosera rotundifolia]
MRRLSICSRTSLVSMRHLITRKKRIGCSLEELANHLDRAISSMERKPLKVLVQVNTSGETSKSGVDPSDCVALAKHVKLDCPNLEFCGLMTIGMPEYTSTPENFKTLLNCRTAVCKALEIPEEHCELSMGLSGDFGLAVSNPLS